MTGNTSLWSLFTSFLKIGSTSFGGFMALISVVQNEMVERRKLLTHEEMLNGISLATILPGPVAVNVVAYVGYRLRGAVGAFVCWFAVILPTFLLMLALSVAYFKWGQVPAVTNLFLGFMPAVIAIILNAAWGMGRKAIKSWTEGLIALAACAVLVGVGGFYITLAIIVASGVVGLLSFRAPAAPAGETVAAAPKVSSGKLMSIDGGALALASLAGAQSLPVVKLFVTFAGMSLFLFGGGYVFIPLIQEVVVSEHHWVTRQEFIDGIALGQIMPGPILVSAAFIGYKALGVVGAIAATIGIFLPPAVLMVFSSRFLAYINSAAAVKAALRGIRAAVIGMIVAAAGTIAATAAVHWLSAAIFVGALVALLRFRVDVAWIIPAAGLAGVALY